MKRISGKFIVAVIALFIGTGEYLGTLAENHSRAERVFSGVEMIFILVFVLLAGWNNIIMADESHQQVRPDSASKYDRLHAQKDFTADESIMQGDLPGDAWAAASAKFSQTRCKQISILNFEVNLSRSNHTYIAQIHLYVKADGAHFLDVITVAVDIDKQRAETTAINKATAKVVQEAYISLEHFCNDPSSFEDDGTRPQQ